MIEKVMLRGAFHSDPGTIPRCIPPVFHLPSNRCSLQVLQFDGVLLHIAGKFAHFLANISFPHFCSMCMKHLKLRDPFEDNPLVHSDFWERIGVQVLHLGMCCCKLIG